MGLAVPWVPRWGQRSVAWPRGAVTLSPNPWLTRHVGSQTSQQLPAGCENPLFLTTCRCSDGFLAQNKHQAQLYALSPPLKLSQGCLQTLPHGTSPEVHPHQAWWEPSLRDWALGDGELSSSCQEPTTPGRAGAAWTPRTTYLLFPKTLRAQLIIYKP